MAEIPIEKKSSMAWLWIVLALIVAALLLWWLLDDADQVEPVDIGVESAQPVGPVGPEGALDATGPITELAMLMPAIDPAMVGREVRLTGVMVQDVISDIGFWIGPSADQRLFAVLSEVRTPNTPVEGMVDVNPGETVDLMGTIRTRAEIVQGMAPGSDAGQQLPEGVDTFIVVSSMSSQGR